MGNAGPPLDCTENTDGEEKISYARRQRSLDLPLPPLRGVPDEELVVVLLLAALPPARAEAQGTWPDKPITLIVPFGRRRRRCHRAPLMTRLAELLTAGGDRERARRRRHHRHPAGGARAGRRLHAAVRGGQPAERRAAGGASAVRYDTFKDFVPMATVAIAPFVLIGPALPAKHRRADPAGAKQPGKLNFGTDGVGTSLHITARCSSSAPASTSCTCPTSRARRC